MTGVNRAARSNGVRAPDDSVAAGTGFYEALDATRTNFRDRAAMEALWSRFADRPQLQALLKTRYDMQWDIAKGDKTTLRRNLETFASQINAAAQARQLGGSDARNMWSEFNGLKRQLRQSMPAQADRSSDGFEQSQELRQSNAPQRVTPSNDRTTAALDQVIASLRRAGLSDAAGRLEALKAAGGVIEVAQLAEQVLPTCIEVCKAIPRLIQDPMAASAAAQGLSALQKLVGGGRVIASVAGLAANVSRIAGVDPFTQRPTTGAQKVEALGELPLNIANASRAAGQLAPLFRTIAPRVAVALGGAGEFAAVAGVPALVITAKFKLIQMSLEGARDVLNAGLTYERNERFANQDPAAIRADLRSRPIATNAEGRQVAHELLGRYFADPDTRDRFIRYLEARGVPRETITRIIQNQAADESWPMWQMTGRQLRDFAVEFVDKEVIDAKRFITNPTRRGATYLPPR